MRPQKLGPVLACLGLACAMLFSAAYARTGVPRDDPSAVKARGGAPARIARVAEGAIVGTIHVPRFAVESPIFEGIAAKTLARGAGHVPKTALPGDERKESPSVIAIPRGDCGAAVARLRLNDRVRLATAYGQRGYRVVARRVVERERFDLASASTGPLTLVTIYPSDSPGPAPMRIAVSLEPMEP
jgi:LPXTG-site transpeptidase (sortase) family protein